MRPTETFGPSRVQRQRLRVQPAAATSHSMAHPNPTMSGYANASASANPNPGGNANPNMYDYPSSSSPQPFPHRPDSMYPASSLPAQLQSASLSHPPYYPPASAGYPPSSAGYPPSSTGYPPSPNPSYNQHPYPSYDPHPAQNAPFHHSSSVASAPYLPNSHPPGPHPPYDPASPTAPGHPSMSVPSPAVHPNMQSSSQSANHSYQPYMTHPQQPHLTNHPSIVNVPPLPYVYPGSSTTSLQQVLKTAEVKLEISAKGLRDRDVTSKSDPTCVVFLEEKSAAQYMYASTPGDGDNTYNQQPSIRWRELARTECIKNNLNPHFKVQIPVPYHFEEIQNIRLGLWDIDSRKRELNHHDFLGDVRTTLAELVTAGVWTSQLSSPNIRDTRTVLGRTRNLGTVTVIVHENRDGGQLLIKAAMSGHKLDKKDLFTSDPYFILTQVGATAPKSRSHLYKSEAIRKNVNPVWKPFQIKVSLPKGGGKQQITLEFAVNDEDRHKRDDEIGKAVCSVADLETGTTLPVINERRRRRRNYKNSGTLKFSKFKALAMPSLIDYLQGGLKLHFSVAVDLTKSNGDPSEPLSLHYRQGVYGNHYIRALHAIANVLRVYTPSDNRFAAFGFGAELPGRPGFTSSCFPLGLGADPHCLGIEGILQAYNIALNHVKLSGPTNFAPIIDIVSRTARQRPNSQTNQNYDVLLILTDGVVSDFDATVDRIITASKTVPLSIIIIGIGNDRNFKTMEALDSDQVLLQSRDRTRQADRDICQFVAFREYEHAPPERLGQAVLAELPGNIVEYFVGACEPPIMPGQRPVMPPLN